MMNAIPTARLGDQTTTGGIWISTRRVGVTVNGIFPALKRAIAVEPFPQRPSVFDPVEKQVTAGNIRVGRIGDPSKPGSPDATGSSDVLVKG